MDLYDGINTASYPEYYPFQGNSNYKFIFASMRYFPLLESFLEDNSIIYKIHDNNELKFYNVSLSEYKDTDFIKINTKNIPPDKFIYSHADKIMIRKNISVDTLYNVLCSYYYADNWYYDLSDLTFKSVLIDLSSNDINSLISYEFNDVLLNKIDSAIKMLITNQNDKVFVKLYSVSPKDEFSEPIDLTAKNSIEVLKLLTDSERTYNSLCRNIKCGIMLREYVQHLDPDNEFRLFVFGYNLRAISQYKCYNYIEKYQDSSMRSHIYELICKWWNDVNKKFTFSDFVADIVFLDNDEIKLIEINSYGPGLLAGSALYNWDVDYDILHYSSKPDIRFLLSF